MIRLSPIFLIFIVSADGFAEGEQCRVIRHERHKFVRIKSRLHHGTHIELPELLIARPVTGNQDLWDVEGGNRHIFVKPNDAGTQEGSSTTVTAVSENNHAYHFLVQRSDKDFDLCVVVTSSDEFLAQDVFSGLARQVEARREMFRDEAAAQPVPPAAGERLAAARVSAAIDEYRTQLFTGYEWRNKRAAGRENPVTDVYDDGRFTYIRVRHNLGGVMSLFAEEGGQEQFIDYRYDERRRLYTVVGIYDRIYLQENEHARHVIHRTGASQTQRDL